MAPKWKGRSGLARQGRESKGVDGLYWMGEDRDGTEGIGRAVADKNG